MSAGRTGAAIPELKEASGLAVSRSVAGGLWAHNDSGKPILFALDARGSVTGRLPLTGVKLEDWEAIAIGPCPSGSCLYAGDIGDNNAQRARITIYRVEEPSGDEASVPVKDVCTRPTLTARTMQKRFSSHERVCSSSPKVIRAPWRCIDFLESCGRHDTSA